MCPVQDAPALARSWDEGWKGVFRGTVPAPLRQHLRVPWLCPYPCPYRGQPPPPRWAPACPGDALLLWVGVIAPPSRHTLPPRSAFLRMSVRPGVPGWLSPSLAGCGAIALQLRLM